MSDKLYHQAANTSAPKRTATMASYISGFVTCIVLSVAAFALVKQHVDSGGVTLPPALVATIVIGLALIQLCIQLFCFLHLGHETKPRYNLMTLGFTGLVLVILVFGSLWIMNNLNYHLMTPAGMSEFMHDNGGF